MRAAPRRGHVVIHEGKVMMLKAYYKTARSVEKMMYVKQAPS